MVIIVCSGCGCVILVLVCALIFHVINTTVCSSSSKP